MGKLIKLSAIVLLGVLLVSGCQAFTPATEPSPAPATANTSEPATPPTDAPTSSTAQPTLPPPTTTSLPPAPTIPVGNQIGNLAPDFQLQTLSGQTVSLSGLRGKPVLINFWATWCPPCKAEMPYLQQVHDSWSAKGLVLLAVDIRESPATVEKFMTELNLSMTVPMDTDGKVAKAYGITAIPSTFFIDKDGIIRQKMLGAFPNKEAIEKELSKIMP